MPDLLCWELLDGRKSILLPQRLIQTFISMDGLIRKSQRFIEPDKSYAGSYVTLSHCLGPPDKRPLCTMKANLNQQLEEIYWGSLSQTFQHSISICIVLSIQYLWINSLCP
jgi:hypothetical protein